MDQGSVIYAPLGALLLLGVLSALLLRRNSRPQSEASEDQATRSRPLRVTFDITELEDGDNESDFPDGFRLPSDPPHVVRLPSVRPTGLGRKVGDWVSVAGISFGQREEWAVYFMAGKSRRLVLERAPHPKDQNAIRVIGCWRDDSGDDHREMLGFVPKDLAAAIAAQHADDPIEAIPRKLYVPSDGYTAGIRMDIWTKAHRKRKAAKTRPAAR